MIHSGQGLEHRKATKLQFQSSYQDSRERKGSQLQHCGMKQSLSQMAFSLSTAGGTFEGNGTKVKGDKENTMLSLRLKENTSGSTDFKRPEGTTCIPKQSPRTAPPWSRNTAWPAVIGGVERLKEASWINVSSRPHSAACAHILHNPAKGCHCKCPLNESPSIPRLAKVRCDWKPRWGMRLLKSFVYQCKHMLCCTCTSQRHTEHQIQKGALENTVLYI